MRQEQQWAQPFAVDGARWLFSQSFAYSTASKRSAYCASHVFPSRIQPRLPAPTLRDHSQRSFVGMNLFILHFHEHATGNPFMAQPWYKWVFRTQPWDAMDFMVANPVITFFGLAALVVALYYNRVSTSGAIRREPGTMGYRRSPIRILLLLLGSILVPGAHNRNSVVAPQPKQEARVQARGCYHRSRTNRIHLPLRCYDGTACQLGLYTALPTITQTLKQEPP